MEQRPKFKGNKGFIGKHVTEENFCFYFFLGGGGTRKSVSGEEGNSPHPSDRKSLLNIGWSFYSVE